MMSLSPETMLAELIKIVVIGDTNSGKSRLVSRYDEGTFSAKKTLRPEVKPMVMESEEHGVMKAHLVDNPGDISWISVLKPLWTSANGAFVVYDITNRDSFESAKKWIKGFKQVMKSKGYVIMLVGNKCDLESNRQISYQEGLDMAIANQCMFLETSATKGTKVSRAFELLLSNAHHFRKLDNNFGESRLYLRSSSLPPTRKPTLLKKRSSNLSISPRPSKPIESSIGDGDLGSITISKMPQQLLQNGSDTTLRTDSYAGLEIGSVKEGLAQ